ncbi:MAG: hypothetical protein V4487_04115 [Chlamydiota bacterium]
MGSVGGVYTYQNVPVSIRQKIETNWQNRKVEILCSFAAAALGIVLIATAILPVLGVFLTAIGFAIGMYNLLKPAQDVRSQLKLIQVMESTDLPMIKASSSPYEIGNIVISDQNKKMAVEVGHSAGNRFHDFTFYVSADCKFDDRNIPGRVFLHHDDHGEPAESYTVTPVVIDLSGLSPLLEYHIRNWANENKVPYRFDWLLRDRVRGG